MTMETDWGGGVMHFGQIFAARGNHQCGTLPSDAQ